MNDEQITELIAEARTTHCKDCDHFMASMADALTQVKAERDFATEKFNEMCERFGHAEAGRIRAEAERDTANEAFEALEYESTETTLALDEQVAARDAVIAKALAVNESSWRRADVRAILSRAPESVLAERDAETRAQAIDDAAELLNRQFQSLPSWDEAYRQGIRTDAWMAGATSVFMDGLRWLRARAQALRTAHANPADLDLRGT